MKATREDIKIVDGKVDKVDDKVERFEHATKEALSELSDHLDDVDEDLKDLRKEAKDSQSRFTSFQQKSDSQFHRLQCEIAALQSALSNTIAIQLNALRKLLDDPIEPVSALISIDGKLVSVTAPDFPQTGRGLWQLSSNIPALIRLSKHYSIIGWEQWQRTASGETDRTEFGDLDIAVTTCPGRCIRALTSKWGLQYAFLERPRKRPAEKDDDLEVEVRRVRLRRSPGTDIVESVISHEEIREVARQDQRPTIQPPRPAPSDSVVSRVEEKYAGAPGRWRTSFESAELGWDANMATVPSLRSEKSDYS